MKFEFSFRPLYLLILSALHICVSGISQVASSPRFSYEINKIRYHSDQQNERITFKVQPMEQGEGMDIVFENISRDTINLRNVVPFGTTHDCVSGPGNEYADVYITGLGEHGLSRSHLFIPGRKPVNVVLPDNAWELGFACRFNFVGRNQVALMRRVPKIEQGQRKRFETILYPGGKVTYHYYQASYTGAWQEGLRVMFQDKKLFDVTSFDDSMYKRKDLAWIRKSYVMHLVMAWDQFFLDSGKIKISQFAERGRRLYGGDDVIGIWPTWPTLGLDSRNQFDLYRDLPGGASMIKKSFSEMQKTWGGVHVDAFKKTKEESGLINTGVSSFYKIPKPFIAYNPWDESTRSERHLSGLKDLIELTGADGVVLDTKGESSKELQAAADSVKSGVVMYSEGMAVPRDMQNIISGRVHNALYYVPMLNLNKFIKPDFAIFRVAELYKEPIKREFATSFFNGYGTELNIFAPGQPSWINEQYLYLGKTSLILRQNSSVFTTGNYTPLISTLSDNIWVNQWRGKEKTLYTIYSMIPQGYSGELFEVETTKGLHYVDLWHHRELVPKIVNGKSLIFTETEAFDQKNLGTNNEGAVDAIAALPEKINIIRNGDVLRFTSREGSYFLLWAGKPSYQKSSKKFPLGSHQISLSEHFGRYEGDFVLQLLDGEDELLDERIVTVTPGEARRISKVKYTQPAKEIPKGMMKIPAGDFHFKATEGDAFIPYPQQDVDSVFNMKSFFMDQFPVTNREYEVFLRKSRYKPSDTVNFLKHWIGGNIPKGQEDFPVVYVSVEDARAYSKWMGKRLPTELEWQYAAQTSNHNEWPWKQTETVTRKETQVTETLTVSEIRGIMPGVCNLGDGSLYKVGTYPKGENPNGLQDLVGCVWQLTNDEYINGSYTMLIMKGGSYFKPSSSWWYVQGGPRELHYRQMLLRVSQGFERNATVGFRCVKDSVN